MFCENLKGLLDHLHLVYSEEDDAFLDLVQTMITTNTNIETVM
jgi:hypothetical protein